MTKEELNEILERLGVQEGVPKQMKESANLELPKAKELKVLMGSMKELFEREMLEEQAKLVSLREQLLKAKKGGCNG